MRNTSYESSYFESWFHEAKSFNEYSGVFTKLSYYSFSESIYYLFRYFKAVNKLPTPTAIKMSLAIFIIFNINNNDTQVF